MGFYLRKSLKVGPLRFNLSKNGIGTSIGVKGLRIGSGMRGNYIHAGTGGFYYKSSLSQKKNNDKSPEINTNPKSDDETIKSNIEQLFNESSHDELVKEISIKNKLYSYWKWYSSAIVLATIFFEPNLIFGLAISPILYMWDISRKSVVLFYDFDEIKENEYKNSVENFEIFSNVKKIWNINSQIKNTDHKRNAGASNLITRENANCKLEPPSFIKCNIPVPTFYFKKRILCFLPDKLLILTNSNVASIEYKDIQVSISTTQFIEGDNVPKDANIVDYTWQYVNKSGGPDKRFKDNKKIPICEYEVIDLNSNTGLQEKIHASKVGLFKGFSSSLEKKILYEVS